MGNRRVIMVGCGLVGGAMLEAALVGCALSPLNSFIDPTKVGMFPAEYKEGGVRRVLTPREGSTTLANATEPAPDDLVARYQEYRIAPGDVIRVGIEDFVAQGQPYSVDVEVSASGYIRLPQLELIKVSGLTEEEAESELRTRLVQQRILTRPVLQVQVVVRRGQTFSIIGAVRQPGTYPITYSDLRLLDAISLAGDIGAGIRTLYVIRRGQSKYGETPGTNPAQPGRPEREPPRKKLIIPPPRDDDTNFNGTLFSRIPGAPGPSGSPRPSAGQDSKPAQRELEDVMNPNPPESRPAGIPPDGAPQPGPGAPGFAPIVFDPTTGAPKEAPASRPLPPPATAPQDDFRWDQAPETEEEQRVIEIDVSALRGGDPRQNVVIRNRDTINVPTDTGLFYVMGEVSRPGVFSFSEREVTLKRAVAVVGGFTPLAWPMRTEIIRREKGTDKQITIPVNLDAIFAGLEDDVLLRDDDIVNVGTHFIAPFLFVIRNSFRFTYGFGFVYDRNFADQDSYGSRINPQSLDQQRRQNRGLPF